MGDIIDESGIILGRYDERPVAEGLQDHRQLRFEVVQGRLYECPVCYAAVPEFKIHRHGVWHASRGEA